MKRASATRSSVASGARQPRREALLRSGIALATAAGYGLLVAFVFAAPPLVRARGFPAMALMRARVAPLAADRRAVAIPVGLGLGAIVALARRWRCGSHPTPSRTAAMR